MLRQTDKRLFCLARGAVSVAVSVAVSGACNLVWRLEGAMM